MSSSKNTIRFSDISSAPIKLKYSSSYYSQSLDDVGITINRGFNHPMTVTGSLDNNALNYELIKQLYYKEYISGSLLVTGSGYDGQSQSTAASGSGDEDSRYFPLTQNSQIAFFYIPRTEFGEQIARNSLHLLPLDTNSTNYHIVDDGNGNLIDVLVNNRKVGNVFYAQGVIVFTDPDYVCLVQDPNFDFFIQSIFPSPTPTPTISITPFLTPTVTPSITPSISTTSAPPSLTPTRTPSKTPSFSVTPSISITPSLTPSVSVTPSVTVTPTPSVTPSISFTPNASISVTPSITPSITPTISRTPSVTPSVSLTPIIGSTLAQLGLTPCFLQSSGFPVAAADNIFLPVGYTDISQIAGVAGKFLYRSYGVVWTTITAIADAAGNIYNVNNLGQVLDPSTSHC